MKNSTKSIRDLQRNFFGWIQDKLSEIREGPGDGSGLLSAGLAPQFALHLKQYLDHHAPGAPGDADDKTPGDAPGDAPCDADAETLGDAPGHETPGDADDDAPGDAPGDASSDAPGDADDEAPGDADADEIYPHLLHSTYHPTQRYPIHPK